MRGLAAALLVAAAVGGCGGLGNGSTLGKTCQQDWEAVRAVYPHNRDMAVSAFNYMAPAQGCQYRH